MKGRLMKEILQIAESCRHVAGSVSMNGVAGNSPINHKTEGNSRKKVIHMLYLITDSLLL